MLYHLFVDVSRPDREVEGKSLGSDIVCLCCLSFPSQYQSLDTMKTAAVLVTLLGSAAAFAPAQQASRSVTSLAASLEGEIGAQAPLGFW